MPTFRNDPNPVLLTKIEDLQIMSALDNGFITKFEMSPEIHFHVFYEVFIAVDGEFYVELLGGESLLVKPDWLCLIPPGVYHCTRSVEGVKKLAVRFNYSPDPKCHTHTPAYIACQKALSLCQTATVFPDCGQLCQIIQTISREMNSAHFASGTYVQTLFTQFYIQLIRMFREQGESQDTTDRVAENMSEQDTRWLKIEEYFQSHYHENITEEHLAAEMNLSKRQLSRVLQGIYGVSFRQMLIETRMHRAVQLLQEGNRTIEEIAYLVGYTSLSGFYSAFHNKFGMTAGEYKTTHQMAAPTNFRQ